MRKIGRLLGGDNFTVKAIVDEIYNLEEKLAMVGYVAILMSKLVTKSWSFGKVVFQRRGFV